VLVGFFENQAYDFMLEENINLNSSNLVFFNSNGEIVFDKKQSIGGGFIIANLPEGFRTITLLPTETKGLTSRLVSHLIISDPGYVSVLNVGF
jgi:hypothetical protein